jgi:hypothetical protein
LHAGQRWLPLTDSPSLDRVLERVARLVDEAETLRDGGLHLRAELLERRAEQLLRAAEDTRRLPAVVVPHGGGYEEVRPPTRHDLAAWLFDLPAVLGAQTMDTSRAAEESERVTAAGMALFAFHATDRDRTEQIRAGYADPETVACADDARASLQLLLSQGLQARLGTYLGGASLRVYNYLAASGIHARGVRVCESCTIVFSAPRARRCRACSRSPIRISPHPWHLAIQPGRGGPVTQTVVRLGRTDAGATLRIDTSWSRRPTMTMYVVACKTCDAVFQATDARSRHCPTGATPTARAARSRQPG